LLVLFGAVEGARREIPDVDFVAVAVPVDLGGGNEVDAPGFDPAIEAGVGEVAGVHGIAGCERLEDVEGVPVAERPGDKGEDGEESSDEGELEGAARAEGWPRADAFAAPFPPIEQESGAEGDSEQGPIGAEEGCVADGEGEGGNPNWRGFGEDSDQRVEAEGDAEYGEAFGERGGGVIGGERAECGEPESNHGGATVPDAGDEGGDEQAGGEVDGDLHEHGGVVMLHAEEGEAESEEEWVAGEADEGGMDDSLTGIVVGGEAVDAVLEPVFGNVAIDEGVAVDFGVGVDEPEAEGGSGGEGQDHENP